MADRVVRGNQTAIEQPIVITSNPGKGGTTQRTFRSVDKSAIDATANLFSFNGWNTVITQEGKGGIWNLVSTLSAETSNDPPAQWEVVSHVIERNLLECTDLDFIARLSPSTKALVEYAYKNPTTAIGLYEDDAHANEFPDAWLALTLLKAGIEARQEHTISARRTITVSQAYMPTWSLTNVGKIISRETLISAYFVPPSTAALLLEGDSAIRTEGPSLSPIRVFKGYKVLPPTYQTVAGNKYQLSQEFFFNKWCADIYQVA